MAALTKSKLIEAVAKAAVDAGATKNASAIVDAVVSHPDVAPVLEPVKKIKSETIQGIVVMVAVPLVVAAAKAMGVELADSAATEVVSTLITLAAGAWAYYGRKTTTRPLA